jgi:LuxR family transcriptional regulator, maltose regulon positive regulatory protein
MPKDLAVELSGTEFGYPVPRLRCVERSALVERLTATGTRFILIAAPAGYGKTTLVAQWRARLSGARSFAGISLGPADNKPRTLWRHITQALLRACPGFGAERILGQLRAISPDITGTVIPLLVNELAALTVPAVLVLDDYDAVSEPECHDQVTFLLNHLPAPVQAALVTRAGPPLPLARWRANGELAEFRVNELRFTESEAALLVRAVSGLKLRGSGLARLAELTEGWPAGLSLAARSLRGQRSPAAFVRRFTGADPVIAGFMAEEVLNRQPPAIRRFLARTSILTQFCAPLCDAVTESAGAAEVLATLERANAFIIPLDETRQWFRYHHLFAQALRHQLDQTEPGIVPVLHRRASEWYRRSGSVAEAIDHAIAGDDDAGAIGLIAANWHARVASGQSATVRGWVRKLDERTIGAEPLAAHCAAWSAAMSGDQESVRRWLPVMAASAREGPLPDGMRSLESSGALLRGFCGFDGLESMSAWAGRAAELESDVSSPWFGAARCALGLSRYLSGDPAGAEVPLLEAVEGEIRLPQAHLLSLSALSLTAGDMDQPGRAHDGADRALSFMISTNLSQTLPASLAYAAAGAAQAGLGRPHEARGELEHALALRREIPGSNAWATIDIMLRLATVLADVADRSSAAALAAEAGLLLADSPGEARALRDRLHQLEQRLEGCSRAQRLADPLTEREVAVLRLLPRALSLREIAVGLGVSVNTIKAQVQSIYRKLGVSARGDAVAHAREAGVL